jgi:hypothetical protein
MNTKSRNEKIREIRNLGIPEYWKFAKPTLSAKCATLITLINVETRLLILIFSTCPPTHISTLHVY